MRRAVVGIAVALLMWGSLGLPATLVTAQTSGAGLVVRHGDGRLVYRYVQFSEPSISGLELLRRSGLQVVTAPYPGLGEAVCAIDGEGCPAQDCFCKSYGSPSLYWNYYFLGASGQWVRSSLGAASRKVSDGDVDGWSWTSSAPGLPSTSIYDIAAMFGVSRGPSASPEATSVASPTVTSTQTAVPTRARPTVPPSVTAAPSPSSLTPAASPTATPTTSSTLVPSPSLQTTPSPTSASPTPSATSGIVPTVTDSTQATAAAGAGSGPYVAFGVMVGLVVAIMGVLWWRSHGR